jgi:hypothetical protein
MDPLTGANQLEDLLGGVKVAFNENKLVDPDFNIVRMVCNQSSMSNHWGIIQGCCNKCPSIQTEITNHVASGTSISRI